MIEAYKEASMAIFKASMSSEVEVLCRQGASPKDVVINRLGQVEKLARVIGLVMAITKALNDNGVPCMNPLRGYVLSQTGTAFCHESKMWRRFLKNVETVGDALDYVLNLNDLSHSVVFKMKGYDRNFFELLLEVPILQANGFAFSPHTRV